MNLTEGAGVTDEAALPPDLPAPSAAVPALAWGRAAAGPTYEQFVAAELPALTRYARVLTGDRQAAHDVVADALVAARLKWNRIQGLEYPAAYVRRIVTTTFLAERRRWSTRHIRSTGFVPDRPTPDPSGAVDDRAALHMLLAGLPRQQRAALVLRFYLDLADDVIATEIGCSVGAVRGYVSRGLAALRITAADDSDADERRGASRPDHDVQQERRQS